MSDVSSYADAVDGVDGRMGTTHLQVGRDGSHQRKASSTAWVVGQRIRVRMSSDRCVLDGV